MMILAFITGIIFGYMLSPIFDSIKKIFENAYIEYKNDINETKNS